MTRTPIPSPTKRRLAVVTSHPIQYQAPLFRELAKHPAVDLTVLFCSDHGSVAAMDERFGQTFRWDVPLLEGYRHEFLPNRSPVPGVGRGFWGELNPGLVRRLASGRFDAVLVHGYAYASCWLAFMGAKLGGARLMMRLDSNSLAPRPLWKRLLKQLLLRPTLSLFDACLPIGTLNYEYYRSFGVSPLRLVYAPYSVDNAFFRGSEAGHDERRREVRRGLGLPEEAPVVLFCGKIYPGKRLLDLLRAMTLSRTTPPICALVAGDGEQRAECERYAQKELGGRAIFVGFKNQTELPEIYAAADVLVLPSELEAWGLVVNEAMAAGLPAITSTAVGAAPDLVWHGETGFVYPTGNVEELAKCLDEAFTTGRLPLLKAAARRRIDEWSTRETVQGVATALRAPS